jgi:hypothetical protein
MLFGPGMLQSHPLHPRALFVSLITKCNLPYKYVKNSLGGCYDLKETGSFFCFFFLSGLLRMWQNIIPTESIYIEDKKVFPKFIWQMPFL